VVKLKGRNIDEVTEVVSGTYLTPLRSAQNSDVVSKIGKVVSRQHMSRYLGNMTLFHSLV
jgi:hypothetical protein